LSHIESNQFMEKMSSEKKNVRDILIYKTKDILNKCLSESKYNLADLQKIMKDFYENGLNNEDMKLVSEFFKRHHFCGEKYLEFKDIYCL
jgi:hypothetical protein